MGKWIFYWALALPCKKQGRNILSLPLAHFPHSPRSLGAPRRSPDWCTDRTGCHCRFRAKRQSLPCCPGLMLEEVEEPHAPALRPAGVGHRESQASEKWRKEDGQWGQVSWWIPGSAHLADTAVTVPFVLTQISQEKT